MATEIHCEMHQEVYCRALEAAVALKRQLEERLIGKTTSSLRTPKGAGSPKVVGITIPTDYRHLIARWVAWTVEMKDDNGRQWSQGLCDYLSWAELFPMFRNAFAGIQVEIEHPYTQLYYGPKFSGSGRIVFVNEHNPAFVRPVGELSRSRSIWLNAELRIDTNLETYNNQEPMLACNIDPLEFGQNRHGTGQYYDVPDPRDLPTFCIRIPGNGLGADMYLPIARLTDRVGNELTFELDQSVECFFPAIS